MSYYVVILRTPPYWSVRVASCNFKLGGYSSTKVIPSLHVISLAVRDWQCDHAQQAILRANLVLLSTTSQKISTWKNLARVAAEEQNGPPTQRKLLIEVFATSV